MSIKRETKIHFEKTTCFHDSHTDDSSSSDESRSKCSYKEKSELCRKFIEKGECSYGAKCKFAHGSEELRQKNTKNSKYKTKECLIFFKTGYCKFGERCNFLHLQKQYSSSTKAVSSVFLLQNYPEMAIKRRQESLIFNERNLEKSYPAEQI